MDSGDSSSLEVERKFAIPDDIQAKLASLNAILVKEVINEDIYIDTSDNALALSGSLPVQILLLVRLY